MRKVGKGRPNPLNQYNLFRPGTYIYSTGAKKKYLQQLKTPMQWTLPLPRLLVNYSSTAHLLPVRLRVVIINKMKNEPVREQFSHCAEVWARYPPQALRARDVKGRLWFRSSNRKTLHKPSNSLQSVLWKLQMSPRNPREGGRERLGVTTYTLSRCS